MNLSSFRCVSKLPFFHSIWRIQAETVPPPRVGFFSESLSLPGYVKEPSAVQESHEYQSLISQPSEQSRVFLNLHLQVVFQDAIQAELAIGKRNAWPAL